MSLQTTGGPNVIPREPSSSPPKDLNLIATLLNQGTSGRYSDLEQLKPSTRFTKKYYSLLAQNMAQSNLCQTLCHAWQLQGIPVIPFKGAAYLMRQTMPDRPRHCADIDLWVAKNCVGKVLQDLESRGYHRWCWSKRRCQPLVRSHLNLDHLVLGQHAQEFVSPQGLLVDLHWHLTPFHVSTSHKPTVMEEIYWQDQLSLPIQKAGLPRLAIADEAWVILSRTTRRGLISRGQWIIDLYHLQQEEPLGEKQFWSMVKERAEQWGLSHLIDQPLRFLNDSLPSFFPDLDSALKPSPTSWLLNQEVKLAGRIDPKIFGSLPRRIIPLLRARSFVNQVSWQSVIRCLGAGFEVSSMGQAARYFFRSNFKDLLAKINILLDRPSRSRQCK